MSNYQRIPTKLGDFVRANVDKCHMGSVERKKRVPQKKPNKLETETIGNLGFLASNSLAPPKVTPVMVQVPGR